MSTLGIRPRSVPVAAVAAAAVLGLTACGTKTIDTDEVESTIVKQYGQQGIKLTRVSCDHGVDAKAGAPISCTAQNPAQIVLVIKGTVTSFKGSKGSFAVHTVGAYGQGPIVAKKALATLEQQVGQKAKGLVCPAKIPIPTTPTVTCTLTTLQNTTYDVTLTLDKTADVHIAVADKPRG